MQEFRMVFFCDSYLLMLYTINLRLVTDVHIISDWCINNVSVYLINDMYIND